MIRKLFRAPAPALPTPGDGVRVYAIGDIHGCIAPLDRLLDAIERDDAARAPARTQIVVLGDVVDRGPASRAVIERLMRLAQDRPATRFLKGNHEEVFLRALEGSRDALRLFCRIGGRETALSYGLAAHEYDRFDYAELAEWIAAAVPAAHRAFLDAFEDVVVAGDYAFVHAGVRPGVAIEEQRAADLRWIREPFLAHRGAHPKVIVHGHTISAQVELLPHRIGVDTGAYSSGMLSAVALERESVRVLHG